MRAPRPLVLAVAATALATGCGPTKQLSLDLRAVSITVPRLLTPAVTLVPSETPVVAPLPPLPPLSFSPPPQVAPPSVGAQPRPSVPVVVCPRAGEFDTPAVTASLTVDHPPAPASYVQTVAGSYATASTKGVLSGTTTQVVAALPKQVSILGQEVESWSVTRTDASKSTSVEVYRLVHPSSSPGATSPGIYLAGLAWTDPVRGDLAFQPSGNGLLVLPSPITLAASGGTQYAGSATDPTTLTTLSVVRNVTGKKRIDACGHLIDTYTVEMTGVLTTQQSQRQLAWTQQLATSFGGLDVQDALTLTEPTGAFTWQRTRTATSVPKPVVP